MQTPDVAGGRVLVATDQAAVPAVDTFRIHPVADTFLILPVVVMRRAAVPAAAIIALEFVEFAYGQ